MVSFTAEPTGWLGGADAAIALRLAGRAVSYGQLRGHIQSFATQARRNLADLQDPLATLVAFYSGALRNRSVIIADTPVQQIDLPQHTFLVVSTSGSAGSPRLVARTAASWLDSFAPFTHLSGVTESDVVGLTGPLVGTLHLFAAVHTLAVGAELTDDLARAGVIHCVPSFLHALLEDLPPRLRTVVVAGGVLSEHLARRAVSAGLRVVEYYGATELSFVAARRVPAPMRAFPGVVVEVRDGRIWARSPYLALGYVGGTSGPLLRDDAGFASVGDLGHLVGGALHVIGRDSSAITTGGTTVMAEDVESVLLTLHRVAAAAVVGRPHPRFGQIVVAVLELESGCSAATIRDQARQLFGAAARPRVWLTIDRLPRTPAGKVARGLVAAGLADGSLTVRPLR